MPKAIVVGPNSMLGRRLIERLHELGWQAISAGRSPDCLIHLNLGNSFSTFDDLHTTVDVVFHCAASFGDDSLSGCWENEKVNTLGCYQILALAQAVECKQVIFAGTIFSDCNENILQINSYGASKRRAEDILSWGLLRSNISFTSLRFGQLYDERAECVQHQLWFGRIVSYAREGKLLRMPPAQTMRNFLYIKDAVDVMLSVAQEQIKGILTVTHPLSETYLSVAKKAYSVFSRGGGVTIADEKHPFHDIFIPPLSPELGQLGAGFISIEDGLCEIRDGHYDERFNIFDVE